MDGRAVRSATADLCAALVQAEEDCFKQWCDLLDGRARVRPDDVVASQMPLHHAAEEIRAWCLADREQAEAERLELLRNQVEGEISSEAAIKARRSAGDRQVIRQEWISERLRIFSWRDAITIGLGWPHRGEQVTVSTWYYDADGTKVTVTGDGVYLGSYDVFNVSHEVWLPTLSTRHREGTLLVLWEPHEQWGNADPAGDIAMRVAGAGSRRLPVPLPRWPEPDDIADGVDPLLRYAEGAQMELF